MPMLRLWKVKLEQTPSVVEVLIEAATQAEAEEAVLDEENWFDVVDEYPVSDLGAKYEVLEIVEAK